MSRKRQPPKVKEKAPREPKPWLMLKKLEGVKWIWADGWWDGVLTGVVEHAGKRYYAFNVDQNYDKRYKWYRRFLVVDLPEEVWKEELERHAFFVEKVGAHFEYDVEKQVRKGQEFLKDSKTWDEFYAKYPCDQKTDYKQFPEIGWFEK